VVAQGFARDGKGGIAAHLAAPLDCLPDVGQARGGKDTMGDQFFAKSDAGADCLAPAA
jgi:hypothetical protein